MKRKVNTFVTMQPKSNPPNFPTSTSSAQVFLASRFLSAEEDLASLIREALSFMKSSDWLKPSDLLIFSLKTCRGYSITPRGKLSERSLPRFMSWGTVWKHIPAYYDKPNMVFGVFLQANGAEEFLQLPEPNSAITKAMKRLGVSDASECTIQCDYINSVTDSLTKYFDNCADRNIFDLNRLSAALILMSEDDENKFYRALDFVQHRMNIDTVGMLADIAQHNSDFVFGPGCDDEYDYGHYLIEDSGRYDYDENLADYYDYAGLGADTARMEHGLFICGDYVGIAEDSELNELLGLNGQGMGGME